MARTPTAKQLYTQKNDLLAERFTPVTPREFYRDMFPEGWQERAGVEERKPNAIFSIGYTNEATKAKNKIRYARNVLLFDELEGLEDVLNTPGAEFVLSSAITYSGRKRTSNNAYHLWGITIDLDGVQMHNLKDLLYQIQNKVIPEPTYIVNSGNGMHVYYLFEEPIPLYRHLHKPLKALKHGLTNMVWNAYTSSIPPEKRQFQGIFQGFRAVGSASKLGKRYPVVAFKTGTKRTLQYLNEYVSSIYQVDYNEFTHLTIDEARAKYPEWYEKRVVQKQKASRWVNDKRLYFWWINQMRNGAFDGNRYHCVSALFAYAIKCNIPPEKALQDALELVPWLNTLTEHNDNDFTEQDVHDAFAFCKQEYVTLSIDAIEAKTRIRIDRNKRNGRRQAAHLGRARAVQDFDDPEGNWRNKNGRPKGSGTAHEAVATWREQNPDGTKAECNRATMLDPKTIRKWWDVPMAKKDTEHVFFMGQDEHEFNPMTCIDKIGKK